MNMTPLEQLAFWLNRGVPVLLAGLSSKGKTYAARRIFTDENGVTHARLVADPAKAHPHGTAKIAMTPQTEEMPLYGTVVQNPDGRFVHFDGPLTKAYRHGMRLTVDEFTTTPADVAHLWNDVMEGESISVKTNAYEELAATKGFQFIATGNLEGYDGNYRLSAATYSRPQIIEWTGMTAEEQVTHFTVAFPKIDPMVVTGLVQLGEDLSAAIDTNHVELAIGMRELNRACTMIEYLMEQGVSDAVPRGLSLTLRQSCKAVARDLLSTFDSLAERQGVLDFDRQHAYAA